MEMSFEQVKFQSANMMDNEYDGGIAIYNDSVLMGIIDGTSGMFYYPDEITEMTVFENAWINISDAIIGDE